MPRVAVDENSRLAIRLKPSDKAILMRAAALEHTNLTSFILNTAIVAAQSAIDRAEHLKHGHGASCAFAKARPQSSRPAASRVKRSDRAVHVTSQLRMLARNPRSWI